MCAARPKVAWQFGSPLNDRGKVEMAVFCSITTTPSLLTNVINQMFTHPNLHTKQGQSADN